MSLRLIYGRAGSGKSFYCLNDIKTRLAQKEDKPLILLVPEQFSLQAEKSLIEVIGTGGIMRADVLNFRRMAHRVFNEVGGITRSHINSAGKCIVLYRIIEEMKENLKVFGKAARQPGFINTMSTMIAEFKRYNVTAEVLEKAANEFDNSNILKSKLTDLAGIFEAFNKALKQQYMDSDDDLTILAQKLDKSKQFEGAEIWIDEFSGFTPQEYSIIGKLLKGAKRVNITICSDCLASDFSIDGTHIFAPAQSAAYKLLKVAKENGIQVDPPVDAGSGQEFLPRFTESIELQHLERNFFSFPYRAYRHTTMDLTIFSSVNIYSEVEETARDIIKMVRDEGLRYRDITVVTRNLEGYRKLIAAIFTQHNIPHFIDAKRNLNSHPVVMLINAALEILIKNWSYESVFRYIKTGLTNITLDEGDILENYVLARGIKGSRWFKEEEWDLSVLEPQQVDRLAEVERNAFGDINHARNKLVTPLTNLREKIRGRKTYIELCTAVYEFLHEIGIPDRINSAVEVLKKEGKLDVANEYCQVWNMVMDVLDQVVEVMGKENTTLDNFSRILAIGFGEYKTGLIPPALDQVLIGSVERSKSHEVKALYVMGVNDGIFPSYGGEEGILSDSDRQSLYSQGVELAQDTRSKAFQEQFMIYTALTTSGKYLRLSYPIANHDGKTMRPSMIISRIRRIFPGIKEYSNIVSGESDEENISMIASPDAAFDKLISVIRKKWEGFEVSPIWFDLYSWYKSNELWNRRCITALAGLTYSNQAGKISPKKIGKLYGNPVYSSVSRLERYASCPFSYYIQYGLKAKERKLFKLSAPDIGTFMHEVMDEFAVFLEREGVTWRTCEKSWCMSAIDKIVDMLLEKTGGSIFNSSSRYKYLTTRLKRVLVRAVWLVAEHIKRSGFEPVGYELAFDENGDFPPITLELPSGNQMKLTGRIDRLDAMRTEEGTYLRIIDYKSGSKAFKLSDVYYGLQIQLITYLDAVWENGGKGLPQPILPGGILYFKIDDPVVRGGSSTLEEDIEKAIMKQLKMKGLLLADVKLIKEMDRQIDGDSLIIPARINKGDALGRSSTATAEQFNLLRRHVRNLLTQMGEEMLQGNVSISPYKKKRVTSCIYCNYSAVCQFDPSLEDNKYKVLRESGDEKVWEQLKEELI